METIIEILLAAMEAGILVGGGNEDGEYSFAVADAKDTIHIMIRPTGRATISTAETDEEQTYDLSDPDTAANFVTDISSMLMDENLDSKAVQFMQIITDAADAEGDADEDEAEDTESEGTEGREDDEDSDDTEEASVPSPFTNSDAWLAGIDKEVASFSEAASPKAPLRSQPGKYYKPAATYDVKWYVYNGPKARSFSKPQGKGKATLKLTPGTLFAIQYVGVSGNRDAAFSIWLGSNPKAKFKVTFTVGANIREASDLAFVKEQADGTFILDKAFTNAGNDIVSAVNESVALRNPVVSESYLDWLKPIAKGLQGGVGVMPSAKALQKIVKLLRDGPGRTNPVKQLKSLDTRTQKAIIDIDKGIKAIAAHIGDKKRAAEAKSIRDLDLKALYDLEDLIEISILLRKGDIGKAYKRFNSHDIDGMFDWAANSLYEYFSTGKSVKAKDVETFALNFCQKKALKGIKVTRDTTFTAIRGGNKEQGSDLANDLLDAIENKIGVYFHYTTRYLPDTIGKIVNTMVKDKDNQVVASMEEGCAACEVNDAAVMTETQAEPSVRGTIGLGPSLIADTSLTQPNCDPLNLTTLNQIQGDNLYFRKLREVAYQVGHNVAYNFFDGLLLMASATGSIPSGLYDLAEEYKQRIIAFTRTAYGEVVVKELQGALAQ